MSLVTNCIGSILTYRSTVSNPAHARYGQHLSQDEVNDLIKPATETLDQVHEWLEDNGVKTHQLQYSSAKDWISVSLPVSEINSLLDTEYSIYSHEEGSHIVRTPEWSLPEHLHAHIDTIQPTNSFFRPKPLRSTLKPVGEAVESGAIKASKLASSTNITAVCTEDGVTPDCPRTLYGTIDYVPAAAGANKVALCNYLGESNNRSDVKIFLETYRPDAVSAAYSFDTIIIDNGNNEQSQENATELEDGKDLEGNLDAETILGIDYPTPMITYNTGGSPPFIPDEYTDTDTNEPYLVWLTYVLGQSSSDLPQTISTSYADDEQTVPYSYATKVCSMFAQLGARGVSVLFASGDSGVGQDPYCVSNDGTDTPTFLPEFPPTCPYVTVVGATKDFAPEVAAYDPENGFYSGGGFSNYFARPSYQESVVSSYLSSAAVLSSENVTSDLYNASGRGYPDIAAQGQHFITVWNGTEVLLDGTSAATPTATAILALVNDALIAAGKSPLGFLNPWLYAGGFEAFTDILSGASVGCNTAGFPAVEGWDAVTGFGTPYFPAIVANLLGSNATNATSGAVSARRSVRNRGLGKYW